MIEVHYSIRETNNIVGWPYLILFLHAQFVSLAIEYAQSVAAFLIIIRIFNLVVTNSVKKPLIDTIQFRPIQTLLVVT